MIRRDTLSRNYFSPADPPYVFPIKYWKMKKKGMKKKKEKKENGSPSSWARKGINKE